DDADGRLAARDRNVPGHQLRLDRFRRADSDPRLSDRIAQPAGRVECADPPAAARHGWHAHGTERRDAQRARPGLPDDELGAGPPHDPHELTAGGSRWIELHFLTPYS